MSGHRDRLEGARVLIISSNEAIRSQLEHAARNWLMTPYLATSVTGALWALGEGEEIQVAIVDAQLPGMSGAPFADRVQSLGLTHEVPIVSVGKLEVGASEAEGAAAEGRPAAICVAKPVAMDSLRAALVRSLCACDECHGDAGDRGAPPGPLPASGDQ